MDPEIQSVTSKHSTKSYKHKEQWCSVCGQKQTDHWTRHIKTHPGQEVHPLKDGEEPSEPFCSNWHDVRSNGAEPGNILPKYLNGRSKAGKSIASRSVASLSEADGNRDDGGDEQILTHVFPPNNVDAVLDSREESKETNFVASTLVSDFIKPLPIIPKPTAQMIGKRPSVIPLESLVAEFSEGNVLKLPSFTPVVTKLSSYTTTNTTDNSSIQQPPTIVYLKEKNGFTVNRDLDSLEQKTGTLWTLVPQLLELLPHFSNPLVAAHIEKNRSRLPNIKALLLELQQKSSILPIDEFIHTALASVLFGGAAWTNLPRMFDSLTGENQDQALNHFTAFLNVRFGTDLANWVFNHWRQLEEQTLLLLEYLHKRVSTIDEHLATKILTLSTGVFIGDDIDTFLTVVIGFSKFPIFNLVLATLDAFTGKWNSESKLSFEQFGLLQVELTHNKNQFLINYYEEELKAMALCNWPSKLSQLQDAARIQNVSSGQARLNELALAYGFLSRDHQRDLLFTDQRYKRTFDAVANAPNTLQFANAQFAAFSIKAKRLQLWNIPSGQGKSRTIAPIALILLLSGSTQKIHMVYDCLHLMQRDQREHADWWRINGFVGQVEYHVGLNFVCKPSEIILIDEADELFFTDPAAFALKIQYTHCICMTATPYNDGVGMELAVVNALGFHVFDGQSQLVAEVNGHSSMVNTVTSVKDIRVAEAIKEEKLVSFIQEELKEYPVLLCCGSSELKQLIISSIAGAGTSVIAIDEEAVINDERLRNLDTISSTKLNEEGGNEIAHTLIITSPSFGMRGLDFRAPTKGITLVLAASFSNSRQLLQALNRVGRFGDPCRRVRVDGVPLIDKEKEMDYLASLNSFLSAQQQKKVTNNLAPLIPPKKKGASQQQQQLQQLPFGKARSGLDQTRIDALLSGGIAGKREDKDKRKKKEQDEEDIKENQN